jgi:hypothetical protein
MKANELRPMYSAQVDLFLTVNGNRLDVAQVCAEYVILKDPTQLPRCRAELSIVVDGNELRSPVYLKNGAVPFEATVEYERLAAPVRNRNPIEKLDYFANIKRATATDPDNSSDSPSA